MYKEHGLKICPSQWSADCKREDPMKMLAGWCMSIIPLLAIQWQDSQELPGQQD